MAERAADVGQRLSAARAGSREALGEVLEACRCYLLLVANQELDAAVQAKGDASELVQETFLEAQRDFDRFHGQTDVELRAWLRQVLLHNLANFSRRYRETDKRQVAREQAIPGDSESAPAGGIAADTPSPSGRAMAREETAALERALERLPEDYRRIILLRNQEDRSFEEIARLMERTENAARKLWFRAIERLRQEMETSP